MMSIDLWISLAVAALAFFARARSLAVESALQVTSTSDAEDGANRFSPKDLDAFRRVRISPEKASATLQATALIFAIAGVTAAMCAADFLAKLILDWTEISPEISIGWTRSILLFSLTFVLSALPAFVFELFMRARALSTPTTLAVKNARAVLIAENIISPFGKLTRFAVRICLKPFGIQANFHPPRLSLDELERLLSEAAKREEVSRQTPKLIHNVFEMNDRIARDIIVPRTQVVALDVNTSPLEMVDLLSERGHSRIPVFKDDIDNIVGILHARDLIPTLHCPELIVIEDAIRPAFFVPWSKPLGDLLRVMQKKRIHMAIVVDEYGGFLGVVTLEDLLETIVGEIRNEYEKDGPEEIEALSDGTFRIFGEASVENVEERMGVKFTCDEPCETMSGLVSYLSGCIPEIGERLFVGGCLLTVEDRSARKITRILCQRVSVPPEIANGRGKLSNQRNLSSEASSIDKSGKPFPQKSA